MDRTAYQQALDGYLRSLKAGDFVPLPLGDEPLEDRFAHILRGRITEIDEETYWSACRYPQFARKGEFAEPFGRHEMTLYWKEDSPVETQFFARQLSPADSQLVSRLAAKALP